MKFLPFGANLLLGILSTLRAQEFDYDELGFGTLALLKAENGRPAVRGEFPWMVYLTVDTNGSASFECGGSIISRRHVLTGSECVIHGTEVVRIEISYGNNLLRKAKKVGVKKMMVHPGSPHNFGLAILEVKRPFHYCRDVQPVYLPSGIHDFSGAYIDAPRWSGPRGGEYLEAAFLKVDRNDVCKRAYGPQYKTDNMICAVHSPLKFGKGFIGGPRTLGGRNGRGLLVGVGSAFGYGDVPAQNVFIRVDVYVPWIMRKIGTQNAYEELRSYGRLLNWLPALAPYYFSSDTPALEPLFY